MDQPRAIMHMITTRKHMSPFDVNMALEAGFEAAIPYGDVALNEVRGLVQDMIFSRAPQNGPRTGLFIGGKDALIALDMMEEARAAFSPPFALSVFADPAGSFTTGAAMVALCEALLEQKRGVGLKGRRVAIFGATGVVGFTAAVLAARQGAEVALQGYDGAARVERAAAQIRERFGLETVGVDGSSAEKNIAIAAESEVIFAAGPAGREIVSADMLSAAPDLLAVADVNAVAPSGVAGVGLFDKGADMEGLKAFSIGPLAIGDVKYKTQADMLARMARAEAPLFFGVEEAFATAQGFARGAVAESGA